MGKLEGTGSSVENQCATIPLPHVRTTQIPRNHNGKWAPESVGPTCRGYAPPKNQWQIQIEASTAVMSATRPASKDCLPFRMFTLPKYTDNT